MDYENRHFKECKTMNMELEKILEEMQEVKDIMLSPQNVDCFGEPCKESDCCACVVNKCMEIVQKHINDGWIPVEERLPEEHSSIFAKFKGTTKWNNAMFETCSNEVNITIEDDEGKSVTAHAHTNDGKWKCDLLRLNPQYHVTAWRPLPEPYRPERN